MCTLSKIAKNILTDKGPSGHGYTDFYDQYLNKYRDFHGNMIEIGVGRGGSVILWHNYFHNAIINMIDIDDKKDMSVFDLERSVFHNGDQGDSDFLNSVCENISPFFIVDDGCHMPDLQIKTFESLFPQLCSGGIYIIEDISGYSDGIDILKYFYNQIEEGINFKISSYKMGNIQQVREYFENEGITLPTFQIETIHFYRNCIVILKI